MVAVRKDFRFASADAIAVFQPHALPRAGEAGLDFC